MERMDRLPRQWRDLINEFGPTVVFGMIEDGHRCAAKLRPELDAWRERRQEQWLSEIPYPGFGSGTIIGGNGDSIN